MIYQKIFTDEKPFRMEIGVLREFPEHRHADFEMNFCIKGSFDAVIDKTVYRVNEGDVTFIPSMRSHAYLKGEGERVILTLIVGMALLKKNFNDLNALITEPQVFNLGLQENLKLKELFSECVEELRGGGAPDELLLLGNVYKILSCVKNKFPGRKDEQKNESDYRIVENIEKAIDIIHYSYKQPLTVEYAASITGYSKSNFCKTFKKVVGKTFHQMLNEQRVKSAKDLLKTSSLSVAEIATEVGFSEAKAFCRVFKEICGLTPGQYRKSKK